MREVALANKDIGDAHSSPGCKHCGLPVPSGSSDFCCSGCEYIFQTIHGLGLAEFYHYRDVRRAGQVAVPRKESYAYFDAPEYYARHVHKDGDVQVVTFLLEGIHCAGCIWLLEKLPEIIPGVVSCRVRFVQAEIIICFRKDLVVLSNIAQVLDSLGYIPHAVSDSSRKAAQAHDDRRLLVRLGVAGFCAANAMMLAVSLWQGIWTGIEAQYADYLRWASLALTIPAVGYSAQPFYRASVGALRQGRLHIDLTISIAIIAAFVVSVWNTLRGSLDVYYDSAALLTFLLILARWVQLRAVRRAQQLVSESWALLPERVRIRDGHGGTREMPLEALQVGQRVLIQPLERVPADGVIVAGRSTFDYSTITGESAPLCRGLGEPIQAGVLNRESVVEMEVTACGSDTRIGRLLERSLSSLSKPKFVSFAEKISQYFVWAVLLLAVATAVWWGESQGYELGIRYGITLLIVTCPCALAIATPLAFTLAGARAACQGILVRTEDALERLAAIRSIYFDKTGTLTEGKPQLVRSHFFKLHDLAPSAAWKLSAAGISHPLSEAIHRALASSMNDELEEKRMGFSDVVHVAGRGVVGHSVVRGNWRLGSVQWLKSEDVLIGDTEQAILDEWKLERLSIVGLSCDGQIIGFFGLRDTIRSQSRAVVEAFEARGVRCHILSGDALETVAVVAKEVGISSERVGAALSPEDKVLKIRHSGNDTAMVGDGVNDAEALCAASVGIGVRSAMNANMEVADMFIMRQCPENVFAAYQGACETMCAIRRALWISVGYNIFGAAAAVLGYINPVIAALLMPLSSLSAIGIVAKSKMFKR